MPLFFTLTIAENSGNKISFADRNHKQEFHDDVIKWDHFPLLAICAGNSPVSDEFTA